MEPDDIADSYEAAYAAGKIDGYNDGRRDATAPLVAALRSLVITGDGPDTLEVNAEALTTNPHRVAHWRLTLEGTTWHHYPSGMSGPLGELLVGIVDVYENEAS